MNKILIVAFILGAIVLSGCTQPVASADGGAGTDTRDGGEFYGTLVLKITDAPIEGLAELNVTISGIEVHKADSGEWIMFSEDEQTFDLMQLQGVQDILGEKQLETGQYTQIRLSVVSADIELEDGTTASVDVPSEKI